MSGTASRFQGRFGYDPRLFVGQYPFQPAPAAQAPVVGRVAPPATFSTPLQQMAAQSAAPVMAGSASPQSEIERQRLLGGGDVGTGVGGAGPTGAASTGSVLGDISAATDALGQVGLSMASPAGVFGTVGGVFGAGLANALGFGETAQAIGSAIGLPGPIASFSNDPTDKGSAAGTGENVEDQTPSADMKGDPTPTSDGFGGGAGGLGDMGDFGSAGDGGFGGATPDGNGGFGGTSTGEGLGGVFMQGGYTGPGDPAEPAGVVHRNEVVIPAHQVARYGLDPLLMLARGQVPPSRLAAMARG
jgi:hypothetical protein